MNFDLPDLILQASPSTEARSSTALLQVRSDVESFDVFDTLLTRAVGAPTAVFLLLGRRLEMDAIIPVAADQFARIRIRAESRARQNCRRADVTLQEIYHEVATELTLTEFQRDHIARLECATEESLLRIVPGACARVAEARRKQGAVLFISDMYLPSGTIRSWLDRAGLWATGDYLYVSNETGAAKSDGRLFQFVLAEHALTASALIHHGNHPHADVAAPRRLGIRTCPFPEGNMNRFETIMERHAAETGGVSSVLAGTSRLARLSVAADDTNVALRDVAAGVVAPILTSYVLWLLRRARTLKLRRLYFLARDGQILLEIARRIAPRMGIKCELRYLHASRQSWHLPGITAIDEARLEWICMRYDSLSIRSLLYRVGLTPEAVATSLAGIEIGEQAWDRQLVPAEVARIRDLLRSGPVHDLVLERASEARATLINYLRQEGVFDEDHVALVDIGWNGRLQASLGEVLHSVDGPRPHGFYYALANRPGAPVAGVFESYLYGPDSRDAHARFRRTDLATLMEIACAADHGSVVGFTTQDGRIAPVLRSEHNEPARAWGLPLVHATVHQYANHLALDDTLFDTAADLRVMSANLIRMFWENPTHAEAEAWGRFPFDNDQSDSGTLPIARPYTASAVVRALLGRGMGQTSTSFWQDGSIMISPPPVRTCLQLGTRMKRFVRRFISSHSATERL